MTIKGIVKKIEGEVIYVNLLEEGACVSCSMPGEGGAKSCSGCGLFANNRKIEIRALNKQEIRISCGDTVELVMSQGKAVLSAVLIFLVPLLLFFAGFMLSGIVLGASDDLAKAGSGVAVMALWYFLLFLAGKAWKRRDWPVVERKLEPAGVTQP